jgi:hypothetical protein
MALDPSSPEAKLLRVLCDMRVDQGFLTPALLSKETGLHVKLVEDALSELEARGAVGKEDDLLKKSPGEPARGFWWRPTFKGYRELVGEQAADELKAKTLLELERQTRSFPDADAIHLGQIYVNFALVSDVLATLEQEGLTSSRPSLTSEKYQRWELTGSGARVLEVARLKTVAELKAASPGFEI